MKKNKTVEEYLVAADNWADELVRLRKIVSSCGLQEEIKWGAPCYTDRGKNIVAINGFKTYFGLWFYQGALLEDKSGVLLNAQEGKTQALRQWRMHSASDIKPLLIKRYIKEAVAFSRAGKSVVLRAGKALPLPTELEQALQSSVAARRSFAALRPGQQRAYIEHVAAAKRADTRVRRVAKCLPLILAGAELNDQYR